MTAMTDPDTGERRRIAIDELVDRLMWWMAGPDSPPPPTVAKLSEGDQRRIWLHMEKLASRDGEAAIRDLMNSLTGRPPAR